MSADTQAEVSDEDLLADVKHVASELGKTPSESEYDEHGTYARSTVNRRFQTWNNAISQCGFETNPTTAEPVPGEELLRDVVRVAKKLGHPPTVGDYDEHGKYHHRTLNRRLGGSFHVLAVEAHALSEDFELSELADGNVVSNE